MRSNTYIATSPGRTPVQRALSRRLKQMASQFREIQRGCVSLEPEQMDALVGDVLDMAQRASQLEGVDRLDLYVNIAAPPAVERLFAAEEASMTARRALTARIGNRVIDPDGEIVRGLDMAIANLQQARTLVAGGRAVQS